MEVWIYIRSYSGKCWLFPHSHVFLLLCSHFFQRSAYIVVINIFCYKLIEVLKLELCVKKFEILYFSGLISTHILCQHQKNLMLHHTQSWHAMVQIILDISFEQMFFALMFMCDCKFVIIYWCFICTHHHNISIFWINRYWSYLIRFLDPRIGEQHSWISFSVKEIKLFNWTF